MPRIFWFYIGALYLTIQSLAAILWWFLLFLAPEIRPIFRPEATPDSALLAFFLPDLILFIGAGFWAAKRLIFAPQTALLPLALHLGGASYGALYCWNQTLLTGEAIWASVLMTPPFLVGSALLILVAQNKTV